MAAFSFLASIYLNEIKNRAIRFGRVQLDILAASLATVLVYSLYGFSANSYDHSVIPFISAVLSFILCC